MTHSFSAIAWRAGFWQREPQCLCPHCCTAYRAGHKASDRTRALAGRPHDAGGHASPGLSGLVPDSSGETSGGEADLSIGGIA